MAEGLAGALVGREGELAQLLAAYRRADAGEPRVMVVVGEAGIGKSRLATELALRVRAADGRALTGACLDLAGGGLPLAPLAEALRELARTEPPDVLASVVGDGRPVTELVPTPQSDEPLAAARLYEGTLGLLGRLASTRPTVILFEDLHWVDRATRDLLTFLVRNLSSERILLVLTIRREEVPAEIVGWLAELGRHPRMERLELGGLDRSAVRAQLVAMGRGDPGRDEVDRIHGRSDGNPFFVEELALAETGELPAALIDLVRSRLGRLSAAARDVVRIAAIGGRSIDEVLVAEMAGRPVDEIRPALREAIERRILVEMPVDHRIGFRHALVREVAAGELLAGEQATLHARLAEILGERPELAEPSPAGAAAELAFHWEAAGNAERAMAAAVDAGAAAARVAAWADADRHYDRAVRLIDRAPLPKGVDLGELYRRASEAAELNGDLQRARERAEAALDAVDADASPERAGLLLTRLGYLRWAEGDTDAALASYTRAAELVPVDPPTAVRARVLASLANGLFGQGRYRDALETARGAVITAEAASAGAEESRGRNVLGSALVALGEVDAGLEELERSRDLAEQHGPSDMRVIGSYNLAVNLAMAGRLTAAEAAARVGREAARAEGLERRYGADLAGLEGDVLTRIGRWDEADAVMAAELAFDPDGSSSVYLAIARARLHALRGETDEAHRWFERVDSIAGEHLDADVAGYRAWARAELALAEGQPESALDICRAGLAPLEGTEDHFVRSPLLVLAVSAAAENADGARARRDASAVTAMRRMAKPLVHELRGLAATSAPTVAAIVAEANAEWSRLESGTDPEPWRAAVPLLAAIPDPYAVARARMRAAEAALRRDGVRADVEADLRDAATTAAALGAVPLLRAVEDLARRSRVALDDNPAAPRATDVSPPQPAAGPPTSLSARELEVLRLVAAGRTNGEIAEELFITRKTASVHVTHILDKLGVANRVEAAMAASRLGLLEDGPTASG